MDDEGQNISREIANKVDRVFQPGVENAQLVYILYLIGILTAGIVAVVGLVMAYLAQEQAPDWLKSHYRFQIRTFWIALLGAIVCFLAIPLFLLGVLGYFALAVWFIIRCIKGLQAVSQRHPIADPASWLFG